MKKEKENYERPSMEVIDVRLEGALLINSPGGTGEGSDVSQDDF